MTTRDVADTLGISTATVHRLVERGDLTPAAKAPGKRGAYLFAADEVERYRLSRSES